MISKVIMPNLNSYRAVNTDYDKSLEGEDISINRGPEETNDRVWCLDAIQYSYGPDSGAVVQAAPVRGGIDIFVGDRLEWSADISDFTGVLNLYLPGQIEKRFTVTLKGSAGYIGKLNVQWHLEYAVSD